MQAAIFLFNINPNYSIQTFSLPNLLKLCITILFTRTSPPDPSNCCRNLWLSEGNLCLEASHAAGGGSAGGSSGCGSTGLGLLDGDAATEGAGVAGVDKLDKAGVGLASNVARAGGASGDVDLEGVVLVDVGGTLHDANSLESASPEALLGLLDVALGARHLGLDVHGGPGGTSAVSVDHGLVWAGTVGGDDVEGAGDGAAVGGDLGEGGAGESHGRLGAGLDVVVTLAVGAAASIGGVTLEDGGVRLSDLVLAGTGDHSALDTEGGTVATGITSCDGDLAVGGNERGGCESDDEDLGEHFEGWWWCWEGVVCLRSGDEKVLEVSHESIARFNLQTRQEMEGEVVSGLMLKLLMME